MIYSGGSKGFDKTIWEVTEYNKGNNPSITFKYFSKDGEEGTDMVLVTFCDP
jgi:aldose 1-epimerase